MGSNPILSVYKRVSVNGKRFAFQAETVGSIPTTRIIDFYMNKINPFRNKNSINSFSSANVITNIIGYFCKKGNGQILENKVKIRLFNRALLKKKPVNISLCLNTFIINTLPYIKVKPKKKQKRRKAQKKLLVRSIDRTASKRKAYINFSSVFKSIKHTKKPFISRLEIELESIYIHSTKRVQSGIAKYVLMEKRDALHKSAYKYIPRS